MGSSVGLGGAERVRRTWFWPAGTRAPSSVNPGGASFRTTAISLEKPSRRRAYTVRGTLMPPRTLTLEGTTRKAKSGRGGLMRKR